MTPYFPEIIGDYAYETPLLNNSPPWGELIRRNRQFFENVKFSIFLISLLKKYMRDL